VNQGTRTTLVSTTAAAAIALVTLAVPPLTHAASPQPHEIESRFFEYLGGEPGFEFTSIDSVRCDETQCRITFTGSDPNPRYVSGNLQDKLTRQYWAGGVMLLTSGFGTQEIAPGAREYVLDFTYAVIDEPSADSDDAARQHAACASAWLAHERRAGEMELPERVHEARAQAEIELAVAAAVLGSAEADRLAKLPDRGPLLGECVPARMFISDRKGDTNWHPRGAR
jgi:hypothetical protein